MQTNVRVFTDSYRSSISIKLFAKIVAYKQVRLKNEIYNLSANTQIIPVKMWQS